MFIAAKMTTKREYLNVMQHLSRAGRKGRSRRRWEGERVRRRRGGLEGKEKRGSGRERNRLWPAKEETGALGDNRVMEA